MDNIINKMLDQAFSVILLIIGLSVFSYLSLGLNTYKTSYQKSSTEITENNDHSSYDGRLSGSQVLLTIMNNDLRTYKVIDAPNNIDMVLNGQVELQHLDAIDLNGHYIASYIIEDGKITSTTYTRE